MRSGIARTDITVVDVSTVIATGIKGICGVITQTQWGVESDPKNGLVGTWPAYVANFGGLLSYSLGPLICRRALEAKCPLRISRVRHYTDITDKTTATGEVATGALNTAGITEVRSTGTITITAVDNAGGDTINAKVLGVIVGSTVTTAAQTPAQAATALAAAITTAVGTNGGYTAVAVGAVVTVKAAVGTGSTPNGRAVTTTITLGSGGHVTTATTTNFANGVTAVPDKHVDIAAKSYGAWGNGVSVTTAVAQSGGAGLIDILVSIAGFPALATPVKNVKQVPSVDELAIINSKLKYVVFSGVSTTGIALGTVTLTGGDDDYASIADVDYIGDPTQGTGINSFDVITDIVKIAVPELAEPAVDIALSAYVDSRGDMISLHRVPVGVDANTSVDYREGTGIYSHNPIDTWRSFMFMGGLNINHPTTLLPIDIPELGDVMGLMAAKDNKSFEWFSFSGNKRGKIKNCNGVVYNVYTPARTAEASNVVIHGLNPVIDHDSFGTVSWGNVTLQKADTLLKKTEVAELCIFLTRVIKPLAQSDLFDPNDIDTWKTIYKRVKKLMDYVESNRGVWKWVFQGDQDIDDISKAVINTSTNIDNGEYLANLWFAPKVGMIFQGIQLGVTNSDVNFSELTGQP